MDQPGKVANPARGQLKRENNISLSPCMPENLVSSDGSVLTYEIPPEFRGGVYYLFKPPYAIGSVPSLSGHAIKNKKLLASCGRWKIPIRLGFCCAVSSVSAVGITRNLNVQYYRYKHSRSCV